MAGIYLHIPFCRQACHYCDFHFSTNLKTKNEMVHALEQELVNRANYLDEAVQTIYFGGGTPSILESVQIENLLKIIGDSFELANDLEITLEANPEDLNLNKLESLRKAGINRLSIGFQTFADTSLAWMNRIHSATEAKEAYLNAKRSDFANISIDLIYALPGTGSTHWQEDIEAALTLNPQHISLYGLTIENRTVFGRLHQKGQLKEIPEDNAAKQYLYAIKMLCEHGYEHYEVANFCKPGYYSRHNSAYWAGSPYLGVGPGAHSFNGNSRQFNVRNNRKYIEGITSQNVIVELEQLSLTQLLNERILTGLRTANGISFAKIETQFGIDLRKKYRETIEQYLKLGLVSATGSCLKLTPKGYLVADDIALQLFFDE